METSTQPTLRSLLMVLALADLFLLGARLWPWQEAMNLPGNGTTGIDPAICLVAYVVLAFWIGGVRKVESKKSLFAAALLGVVAGMFLMAQVAIAVRQSSEETSPDRIQLALLACAAVVLGITGFRAARAGNPLGFSALCSIWASMLASLMAVAAILGETFLSASAGESSDPWKQYEGLAIGTPATQFLVHSLDTISAFLLLGPMVGCIAGSIFASFGGTKKD